MPISMEALTGFANSRRWEGRWIWLTGCDPRKENTYALFRREFSVGETKEVRVFISADTKYRLYVNGKFIGQGPPLSMPFFQYYNEHDLSGVLRQGENCIGVIVYHSGIQPQARGGVLAEVVGADGKAIVATDASWRGMICRAWQEKTFHFRMNVTAPFQEHFDSRAFPDGFAEVGFDGEAAKFREVEVVGGRPPTALPWSRLVPRDIAYLKEEPMLAVGVEVGESLGLNNRMRPEDLATTLSQPMVATKRTKVEGAEKLVTGEGCAVVQCSTEHLEDMGTDGIYEPSVLLDFGKVVTGYLELELEVPGEAEVEIGYAERLIDGHFNIAIEGQFADRYVMKGGRQRFVPFNWRAFRYVKLKFRNAFEPVKVHGVRVLISRYPFENRGGFAGSDAMLNKIFEISRYTLRLCSNEALMDTPWREAAQWLGDVAAVTQPAIHACFGDAALTGKFLRQAAMNQYQTGLLSNTSNISKGGMDWMIPDYSLWWIIGLWEQYMYTGQRRWVEAFYPQVLRILQGHLCHVNERGLVEDMPFWVFVDWADVDKRGECAAYNAIFYGTLAVVEQMAELKGDKSTLETVRTVREAIKANFMERLFDAKRGLVADARIGEELSSKTSEQGNMAAIRFGLVDEAVAKQIVSRVFEGSPRKDVTEAQPFFMVVVLQALQRVGRMDLAIRLMKDRWGKRMVDRGATSVFEEWSINGSRRSGKFEPFMRTQSHAWSACPAEFLIRHLMGLEIVGAGCERIRLAPAWLGFDYEAAFPTPKGIVRVICKQGKVETQAPEGVVVEP
ncbi:MAG: family 78 glycoside hydrolase catalytic domain [Phycisphaerales bacterium]|nr:family 78 glycoside hydrolase catalytic domain [Phycisphaerales bacterium]